MLKLRSAQVGMSLIELVVGMLIVGVLLTLAAPIYMAWVENAKIRTTAEAIQNGLRLARAEAVRRNTQIRFQLLDVMTPACQISASGSNWVVSFDDPSNLCCQTAYQASPYQCVNRMLDEAFDAASAASNPAPRMIQVRTGQEGSSGVQVAATLAGSGPPATPYTGAIVFNGLGRNAVPAADINIDVSNTAAGACASIGGNGPIRCLRVAVSRGGQVRLCDPARPSADPVGC